MPGSRKKNYKKFRDVAKQGASHFEVGYRSQKDPMVADSEASEHVLIPKAAKERCWEEQQKYGIYFEDDYNYLQHLKDARELNDSEMTELPSSQMKEEEEEDVMSVSAASTTDSRLQLPSSVLGSVVERDVGILNMAAPAPGPKLDWDTEIVAALDDDFDFDDPDNLLEDDFMQMANADEDMESGDEGEMLADDFKGMQFGKPADDKANADSGDVASDEADCEEDEEGSDVASDEADLDDDDDEWTDDDEEDVPEDRLTRISRYSSCALPRNDKLRLLDEQTKALLEREYTDDKIGALDGEDLRGRVTCDSDLFRQVCEDFFKSRKQVTMRDIFNSEEKVPPVITDSMRYVEETNFSDGEKIDLNQEPLVTSTKPKYDAQTILSTYSTTKNLPTNIVIPEEWNIKKKKKKPEAPSEKDTDSTSAGLTLKELQEQAHMERLADAPLTYRPKQETREEKTERKKAVKTYQKERRAEKKLVKLAFQKENQHQKKVVEAAEAQKKVKPSQC